MTFYTNVRQWGNSIYYIGYDANGKRTTKDIKNFSPTVYTEVKEDYGFKSLDGVNLKPTQYDKIKDATAWVKQYSNVKTMNIYGADKFVYEFIARYFNKPIKYSFNDIRIFYIDIETGSDNGGFPDQYSATAPIRLITIRDSKTKRFITWGLKDFDVTNIKTDSIKHYFTPQNFEYRKFDNEVKMLQDFVGFWQCNYPDIVTGWNTRGFDIPFIINRVERLLGEVAMKHLSPWNIIQEKSKNIKRFGKDETQKYYDIYGINEIDYMDLYKKYTYTTEESYSLGYISQLQLGETKLDYEGSLDELYEKDHQTYVEYNVQDTAIIEKFENKLKFLELLVEVSYIGKVPVYEDSLGTTKFWEVLIYNHLMQNNIIDMVKTFDGNDQELDQYEGAFVKSPVVGRHKWMVSVDAASLYPTNIRTVNIGPETIIDNSLIPNDLRNVISQVTPDNLINKSIDLSILKQYDVALSGNGKLFKKDKQSFLSQLMEQIYNQRTVYKKLMLKHRSEFEKTHNPKDDELAGMYDIKQQAMKILINAAYGAVGNKYFKYFSVDNAEAVTITGKVVILWTERKINEFLNRVCKTVDKSFVKYIDTDSCYICLEDVVNIVLKDETDKNKIVNFLDNFCKVKLEPMLQESCTELYDYLNHKEDLIIMKRESICDVGVWTKKKRYFLNVYDNEGTRYSEPKIKVTGLAMVASSTPQVCRKKLKNCLDYIVNKENSDLIDYINEFKTEFFELSPELIGTPTSINDIDKYTDIQGNAIKGAPMHVKGSINYNKMLKNLTGAKDIHREIKNGDKVKVVSLMMPNILGDDCIAFPSKLPQEFRLEKYINYHKQFEKVFINPLKKITDVIGWKTDDDDCTLF